ncbi:ribosomal protein S5 domain 2-type protein [Limtongia smithiae]|uniref:ribosomal protein S5 domain 2-type protein n=1 Tax=Limtongia smithiae TaxID=1125753 RepID=UPI0034CEE5AD
MSGRPEIYSPEGLRLDGRRWNELRQFKCALNTHPVLSDGSSVVEQGNTKVICNVFGPGEPGQRRGFDLSSGGGSGTNASGSSGNGGGSSGKATIDVKVVVAPFSTMERRKRGNDSRMQELALTIQHVFEGAILRQLHPKSRIEIALHVLAQDGGVLQACVNAASLALVDAGVPMYDYVCACTAGVYDKEILLDLNRLEEGDMPFMTLATIGKSSNISLMQLESKVQFDRLESIMAGALAGCHHVRDHMDRQVRKHGKSRLEHTTI